MNNSNSIRLKFPFKNISIHYLFDFLTKGYVKDFILTKQSKYPFSENYFENKIGYFRDSLPNFENEILQIINTTNQETIDYYFTELLDNIDYIRERVDRKNIESEIENWNNEELKQFDNQVEKDTDEYFKSENRKLNHLAEYEENDFGLLWAYKFGGTVTKVKRINYNFYCIENKPDLIEISYLDEYHHFLIELSNEFLDIYRKYEIPYSNGKIKSKVEKVIFNKPAVFVEGEHDITFIQKAAKVLNMEEILTKIELRQRGGYKNLDKIWNFYSDSNWETVPQKKILLYDCDTKKEDDDFGQHIFKRVIPTISDSIITKGIENLFPKEIVNKAINSKKEFVDFKIKQGLIRGKEYKEECVEVNKDEKRNFCQWVCDNGTADDFKNFHKIFAIIQSIVI